MATINISTSSTTTNRGFFNVNTSKEEITEVVHSTWLRVTTPTKNTFITCLVNGQIQELCEETYHAKWSLDLVPGDEVTLAVHQDNKTPKSIFIVILEDGAVVQAEKGHKINHEETHKNQFNINSKFKRGA